MGKLLVDVGQLTASKQIANAKAAAIIDGFVEAQGGPAEGTPQERLDWFIERIADYVRDVYRRHKREKAVEAAAQNAEASTEAWE